MMTDTFFHPLHTDIQPPSQLNNPFDYEPHPLCQLAFSDMLSHVPSHDEGKMYGVLVVRKGDEMGYLAAYSGQINGRADWDWFVPPVFDYLQPDGYFKQHENEITQINHEIERLENLEERKSALVNLAKVSAEADAAIAAFRQRMAEAKKRRDEIRKNDGNRQTEGSASPVVSEDDLIRESQFMKAELRRLKKRYAGEITVLRQNSEKYESRILSLRNERKEKSDALQNWLFLQFEMLNAQGEKRTLLQIFADTVQKVPPSGAGECCEPKLFQYAFAHHLQPLCLANYWHGPSPKTEIRHDGHHYPACRGKCLPILRWMLGMEEGSSVFHSLSATASLSVKIIYEDADIVVVDKPAGLLSIPGIDEQHSVWSIIRKRYPHAASPLLVHRLDQPTSGLLIIAKTKKVHYLLQQQFERHEVKKRYVALLEPTHEKTFPRRGQIALPLRPDPLNRPYQVVDEVNGKRAVTEYEFVSDDRVLLYPQTGRTHQLRVHCAHLKGLNRPILGDNLYGRQPADRLYLHAEAISFVHPLTGQPLHLESKAPF